jgi:hypothetical protein
MPIKEHSQNRPHWHYQLRVAELGVGDDTAAKAARAKAFVLGQELGRCNTNMELSEVFVISRV